MFLVANVDSTQMVTFAKNLNHIVLFKKATSTTVGLKRPCRRELGVALDVDCEVIFTEPLAVRPRAELTLKFSLPQVVNQTFADRNDTWPLTVRCRAGGVDLRAYPETKIFDQQ